MLTNDDGVHSPGLAALAGVLAPLGELLIVAPREQQSGMGRSLPMFFDGRMVETTLHHNGQSWPAYGVNASPAQCVLHALLELAPRRPALAVSGINYGENVGGGITVSGTVGAALEAAAGGIPALAVSLEVPIEHHTSNDAAVDFGVAAHFAHLFAARWLQATPLPDVDVLKIDVPASATPETPWRITHLERARYFRQLPPTRKRLDEEGRIGYMIDPRVELAAGSDAGCLKAGVVSVTPLSIDLTSHIDFEVLRNGLENGQIGEDET